MFQGHRYDVEDAAVGTCISFRISIYRQLSFRGQACYGWSSSHNSIRSIGKALSQRPYAMMTSEAFDLGGGTVSRGFWVTIGWHLGLGNHQQGFFLGLTWHRIWQKTNNLYQVQHNLEPFCCNHELIGLLRARVEGCWGCVCLGVFSICFARDKPHPSSSSSGPCTCKCQRLPCILGGGSHKNVGKNDSWKC